MVACMSLRRLVDMRIVLIGLCAHLDRIGCFAQEWQPAAGIVGVLLAGPLFVGMETTFGEVLHWGLGCH